MTKRLYYDNSYLSEFKANLIEQYRKGDFFAIILDQTAFYPTSGGQMADKGMLNDQSVKDVIEEGEEIAHLVAEPVENEVVIGKIDWTRRFDFMQQHTGFHILAQSFLQTMGIETLSSHLGENSGGLNPWPMKLLYKTVRSIIII
jgi:alanyl-tRNA synthetase